MKKNEKTNVMRVLEQNKIPYNSYTYADTDAISGVEVATVLNQDPNQVFKTLVTVGNSKTYYVFMIPVHRELDLKKAASSVGEKSVSMIHVKDINKITGYIRGGCSPVGMKKKYPTYFDETCELYDTIAVSAGERGHQMVLPPLALAGLVEATLADLTV